MDQVFCWSKCLKTISKCLTSNNAITRYLYLVRLITQPLVPLSFDPSHNQLSRFHWRHFLARKFKYYCQMRLLEVFFTHYDCRNPRPWQVMRPSQNFITQPPKAKVFLSSVGKSLEIRRNSRRKSRREEASVQLYVRVYLQSTSIGINLRPFPAF